MVTRLKVKYLPGLRTQNSNNTIVLAGCCLNDRLNCHVGVQDGHILRAQTLYRLAETASYGEGTRGLGYIHEKGQKYGSWSF